jgi:TonB family protein
MSTPQEKGYFLELNEYFLLAARTSSLGGPPLIEDLREAPLDSKAAVGQLLNTVFPEAKKGAVRAVCALRPRHRFFHLAVDSETRQYSTPTALRAFVSHSPEATNGASEMVALQTSSGAPLNCNGKVEGRWIFEGSPHDSLASMQATVLGWKLLPYRVEAATLALLGAIHAEQQVNKASGPLLLWEIGETTSDLFLISARGLMAAKRLAFGFDQVAESVQVEIKLKSKESAAKMFFNEFYDFSEIGAKITARISTALLPEITSFVPADFRASVTLLCTGLPSKQAWFNEHLARSLGLAAWQPDIVGWCGRAGLNFIGNTLQVSLSPVWLGLLGVMSAFQADKPEADVAWHPVWNCNGQAPAASDKPAVTAAPPKPEPAPVPAAAPVAVKPQTPPTALPTGKPVIAAARPPPPPPSAPATTPLVAVTTAPAKPAEGHTPATRSATSVTPLPTPGPASIAVPPAPPLAVPTAKAVAASTPSPTAAAPAKSPATAATAVPEKPIAGEKAPTLGATSAAPVAIPAPATTAAPPAPTTVPTKVETVSSAPPPPPPAPAKTRASAVTTAADKPAKVEKSAVAHVPSATPKPAPSPAATIAPQPPKTPITTAKAAKFPATVPPSPATAPAETPPAVVTAASEAPATATPKLAAESGKSSPIPESSPAPAPAPAPSPAPLRPPQPSAPNTAAAETAPLVRESVLPSRLVRMPAVDESPVRRRSFLKTPVGVAVIGSAVMILGATIFFYHQFAEEKAAALRAQAAAEQRAAAEATARREAEQQTKLEAEARRRAEAEVAQKNVAAETARVQAAEAARLREMETTRVLNGRGSLVLATEPAGATVEISNLAPRVTPVTIGDLRLGHYAVKLSLPGYEPANLDVEIKDNEATDPGPIRLVRQTGSLTLATEPAGVNYEVRPAASRFFAAASDLRQGKTPATLADLPTGDYTVIFSREGWPNHTQSVVIEHNGTAQASSGFAGGTVTITSSPAGASVTRNGLALGVTPLGLADVQPGEATYILELNGFIPAEVTGVVEPEKTIHLDATFSSVDRIARMNELDERPAPIKTVEPAINPTQDREGGKVTIALTIDRDGIPKDLKVEEASSTQLGRRCLDAAAQWRFKPGKIKGVPVKTRVSLPFNIAAP